MPIFGYPDEPRWNPECCAVQFTVEVGEYAGLVSVPRRVFERFLGSSTDAACLEAFYRHRAEFEHIVEERLAQRDLTADGQIEIKPRDLAALISRRKH